TPSTAPPARVSHPLTADSQTFPMTGLHSTARLRTAGWVRRQQLDSHILKRGRPSRSPALCHRHPLRLGVENQPFTVPPVEEGMTGMEADDGPLASSVAAHARVGIVGVVLRTA